VPNIVSSKGYPLLLRNLLAYGPFRFTAYGCSMAESTSPNLCLSSYLANDVAAGKEPDVSSAQAITLRFIRSRTNLAKALSLNSSEKRESGNQPVP
jgi:hypothetical protein